MDFVKKRQLFCGLFALIFSFMATVPVWGAPPVTDTSLQFNQEGKFTILILTDIHETEHPFRDSIRMIQAAVDKTQPDFVVFGGDNIAGEWNTAKPGYPGSLENVKEAIRQILEPVVSKSIPFAVVFGNHDHESGVTREEQMKIYQSYPGCLAIDEGETLPGCGTYNLTVKNSAGNKNVFNLWFFDSHSGAPEGMPSGYAAVEKSQIEWYENTSDVLKSQNGGKVLPSLAFQHIPVPEVYDLFQEVPKGTKGAVRGQIGSRRDKYYKIADSSKVTGKLGEGPCSPDYNNGQFASWKSKGDVLGAFFGHDHVNDYLGKLDGIYLGATKSAGVRSYGDGTGRGVRSITLDEKDLTKFDTQTYYFSEIVKKHLSNPLTGYLSTFDSIKYAKIGGAVLAVVVVGAVAATILVKKKKKTA